MTAETTNRRIAALEAAKVSVDAAPLGGSLRRDRAVVGIRGLEFGVSDLGAGPKPQSLNSNLLLI
jgi:hypothetical protein